jgi:hypothetical protein
VRTSDLARACAAGEPLDLALLSLDADVVRELCVSGAGDVDPRGLVVRRGRITGALDLSGATVGFPLRFEDCWFDAPVRVEGADLHQLSITSSPHLPGLLANGLTVRRDLDLSGSRVRGVHATSVSATWGAAIWLCEARVGGRFLCAGTVVDPAGQRAVHADRLEVAGSVRLIAGFTARGEVRMVGARVGGSFDVGAARIGAGRGVALDLADITVDGSLLVVPAGGAATVLRGRLDLGSATVGAGLIVDGAVLDGGEWGPVARGRAGTRRGGTALSAPGLTVGGDLSFEGACLVTGGVDLSMGDFGSLRVGAGCVLRAAERTALDLTSAHVRSDLHVTGVRVDGTVRLAGAHVEGRFLAQRVHLRWPERGILLNAEDVRIDGYATLAGARVDGGGVLFRHAELANGLQLAAAHLSRPGGTALNLHRATIRGAAHLDRGFRSEGRVLLSRASIGGRLDLTGGTFVTRTGPDAIVAEAADVRGGLHLGWSSVEPGVDLTSVTTTVLADDPRAWPSDYVLAGLTYERWGTDEAAWDGGARRAWLRGQRSFDAGPYEQAARVFRQHGYLRTADEVLMEQRAQAARAVSARGPAARLSLARDALYGATVGYGHRPGRVLWLLGLLFLLVLGSLLLPQGRDAMRAADARGNVHAPTGRLVTVEGDDRAGGSPGVVPAGREPGTDPCGDGRVRCFNPVLYAVDTVVPLVSLGQRATWYPAEFAPWGRFLSLWLNAAALAGWTLSTIFVLSFARLARPS